MKKAHYIDNFTASISINPKTGKRSLVVHFSDMKNDWRLALPENYIKAILENTYQRESSNLKKAR